MPKEGKGKRPADDTVDDLRDAKDDGKESEISMLDFEDAFEDEFEEEELIEDGKSVDGSEDEAGEQSNAQKKVTHYHIIPAHTNIDRPGAQVWIL